MGYILKNGISYSGNTFIPLTKAQYDALVTAGTVDPAAVYFITDRSGGSGAYAAEVAYDNSVSELSATNVQSAIDEVIDRIYPVGSIYMSVTDSTVAQVEARFGGTWEAFATGKTLIGVDVNDADFDTVEETGGAKSNSYTPAGSNSGTAVTMNAVSLSHSGGAVVDTILTIDQIPVHTHSSCGRYTGTDDNNFSGHIANAVEANDTNTLKDTLTTGSAGRGQAHGHDFKQPKEHSFTPTTNTVTNPTFTGTAANISTVQPYITCYMYKRTA